MVRSPAPRARHPAPVHAASSVLVATLLVAVAALGASAAYRRFRAPAPHAAHAAHARAPLARDRALTPVSTVTAYVVETAQFFRGMGFFRQFDDMPDVVLGTHLEQLNRQAGGAPLTPEDPVSDLRLLRHDAKRVWWRPLATSARPDADVYADLLTLWGAISRGAFQPRVITESWQSAQGPITVEFTHEGTRHRLRPRALGGRLDIGVLKEINLLIEHTGYRFEMFLPFDDTAFVVVLSPAEKSELIRDRGWVFAW